jgi:hypothetical protein
MHVIYLKHSTHGTKIAIAEAEAEADEKNGWERYTPGEEVAPNELVVARRGRPRVTNEHDRRGPD